MPFPLIPAAIVAGLSGLAIWRHRSKKGMTLERRTIYENALKLEKDPDNLRKLAKAFADAGLKAESAMLMKRAKLRELPQEIKDARTAAYKRGMALKDPAEVEKLAAAFDKEGATGAAHSLRVYALGLRTAGKPPTSAGPKEVVDATPPPAPVQEQAPPDNPPDEAVPPPVPQTEVPSVEAAVAGEPHDD